MDLPTVSQNRRIALQHYHRLTVMLVAIFAIQVLIKKRAQYREHAVRIADARKLADNILYGPDQQFQDLFRLNKRTFRRLLSWLQLNAELRPTRYVTAEQKLMIVLWTFAHAEAQRNTASRFGVSQSTVSSIIAELLPMLGILHRAVVRLPDDDWLDPIIELNPRLNAFNGCIGALDGTHIAAHIPKRDQLRWRDRKGNLTQNVFAAVRSDYSFSYVLAGAEGSMNDASLCAQAFGRGFHVPANRFYVVDAGFGARDGIVLPFPGVRYHLEDWRNASRPVETKKELYNLQHARIRVVVEKAFGQLKRRWKIVRVAAPEYDVRRQVEIIYAVTALHNFILQDNQDDIYTSVQLGLMSLARSRAERVLAGSSSDQVRLLVACALWDNWVHWKNRTGRVI